MALPAILACGLFGTFSGDKYASVAPDGYVYAEGVYKPITVEIAFECLGNSKLSDDTYNISISAAEKDYPIPDKDSIIVTNGEGSFFITFTEPGDYTYFVFQKKGDGEGVIYDETEYEIHINVMNKDSDSDETRPAQDSEEELMYYMSVNYKDTDKKPTVIMFVNEQEETEGSSEITSEDTEKVTEVTTEETTEKTTQKTTEETTEKTTENTTEKTETTSENTTEGISEDVTVDTKETVVDNTSTTEESNTAKTGDKTPVGVIVGIMTGSLLAVIILLFVKRYLKKKRELDEEE